MANLTTVGIAAGVPNSGTGTVSTIDGLMAVLPVLESGRTPTNVITGQAGVAGGAGTGGASTQRVVIAQDAGAVSTSRIVSATADTNPVSAKASAGVLFSVKGYNAANAVRYLKFYNKASAPTVGTDTPVLTFALPPLTAFVFDWPLGRYFATGIAFGMVTGSADNSTAALVAADVVGLNVEYA